MNEEKRLLKEIESILTGMERLSVDDRVISQEGGDIGLTMEINMTLKRGIFR